MAKFKIKLDTYVEVIEGLEEPTIRFSVFKRNDEDLSFFKDVPFSELVASWVESNSIPDGTMRPENKEETTNLIDEMIGILKRSKKKIKKIPLWNSSDYE